MPVQSAAFPARLAGAAAVAFALLTLVVSGRTGPLLSFDGWASALARSVALAHPLWRAAMLAVTTTGSTTVLGPLTAAGCLILLAYGRWRQAVFAATATIVTLTARLVVLDLVARPRPAGRLAPASSYSFPSGHTTAAATAALILVVVGLPMLPGRRSRIALCAAAGTWAFAVGLSRVALVVHWPTDVLGGWLFVLAMVPAVGLLLCRLLDRPGVAARRPVPEDGPPA
jgi:undecaprenyl-diphosphatase